MKLILILVVLLVSGCAICPDFNPETSTSRKDPTLQADVLVAASLGAQRPDDQRSYKSVGQSRVSSEKRGDVLP